MSIQDKYDYCLQKNGITEHFPFNDDTLVFKVGGKMFAATSLKTWEHGQPAINLKCNPQEALVLRADYQGVIPGNHMNKQHWNTVLYNQDVPIATILELINKSYQLVHSQITKKSTPKKNSL